MAASDDVVVRCVQCGTKNRVDLAKAAHAVPSCANCHEALVLPDPQEEPLELDDATFRDAIDRSPVPVFVEFYSPYCIHCQRLEPVVQRLARDSGRRLSVAKINIDSNRYTASQYQVQGTPTFLLLDRDKVLARIPGAVPEQHLRYRLHEYLH